MGKFVKFLGIVIILAVVGLIAWWATPVAEPPANTPAPAPEKVAPPTIKVAAPVQVAPPVQVAAPVAPPAPVVETPPVAQPALPPDPRLDLATALPDFLNIVQSGDYLTATEDYLALPPNTSAQQVLAGLQQNPNFPQMVQMAVDTMRAAQSVAPSFNDAGDVATYTFPAPVDGQPSVRWRKVDGKWTLDGFGGN